MFYAVTRSMSEHILLFLLGFQGLSGLYGGWALISEPTENKVGISLDYINAQPFNNYFFLGAMLFLMLGVAPLIVLYFTWYKYAFSWRGARIVGLILLAWIGVQIRMMGYQIEPPTQLIYGVIGLAIVACTLFFKPKYYS
jgi:hypothetical protein